MSSSKVNSSKSIPPQKGRLSIHQNTSMQSKNQPQQKQQPNDQVAKEQNVKKKVSKQKNEDITQAISQKARGIEKLQKKLEQQTHNYNQLMMTRDENNIKQSQSIKNKSQRPQTANAISAQMQVNNHALNNHEDTKIKSKIYSNTQQMNNAQQLKELSSNNSLNINIQNRGNVNKQMEENNQVNPLLYYDQINYDKHFNSINNSLSSFKHKVTNVSHINYLPLENKSFYTTVDTPYKSTQDSHLSTHKYSYKQDNLQEQQNYNSDQINNCSPVKYNLINQSSISTKNQKIVRDLQHRLDTILNTEQESNHKAIHINDTKDNQSADEYSNSNQQQQKQSPQFIQDEEDNLETYDQGDNQNQFDRQQNLIEVQQQIQQDISIRNTNNLVLMPIQKDNNVTTQFDQQQYSSQLIRILQKSNIRQNSNPSHQTNNLIEKEYNTIPQKEQKIVSGQEQDNKLRNEVNCSQVSSIRDKVECNKIKKCKIRGDKKQMINSEIQLWQLEKEKDETDIQQLRLQMKILEKQLRDKKQETIQKHIQHQTQLAHLSNLLSNIEQDNAKSQVLSKETQMLQSQINIKAEEIEQLKEYYQNKLKNEKSQFTAQKKLWEKLYHELEGEINILKHELNQQNGSMPNYLLTSKIADVQRVNLIDNRN